jgi:hypothetical protein
VRTVCSVQRCTRRPWADGICRTHLDMAADKAFRRMIRERDGYCTAARFFPDMPCLGGLQGMHLVPVGYRALRWDPENAAAGCMAHHKYLTEHPIEHGLFCEQLLGAERWEALRARRFGPAMRPDDALRELEVSA